MHPTEVKEKIIAVLTQIQTDSGLECPQLHGETKPVGSLPKFDSKVWPVATTLLAAELGGSIPDDVNIFIDDVTKLPRSIDQVAILLCEMLKKNEAAAA